MVCQKVRFEMLSPSAREFEGINDRASQDLLKICSNLLYSLSFVSYGSVKILSSHFSHGAPLPIRLAVSCNFFKIEKSLHATNRA